MKKCIGLMAMIFVFSMVFAGPLMALDIGDVADKSKGFGDKIADTARDLDEILESGKEIIDQINEIGDIVDPKMNPYYLQLKLREINMALEHYRLAKKRYEETGWYRPFARRSRKKEMEKSLDEYMSRVLKLAQAKYEFAYDVYKNTSGFMSWRLPARQEKYQKALREYSQLQLDWASYKLRKAKQEYEDTPVIFFLSRMARKKAYEEARDEYEQTLAFVETLWMDAGLIQLPFNLPAQEVVPGGEIEKIDVNKVGDM